MTHSRSIHRRRSRCGRARRIAAGAAARAARASDGLGAGIARRLAGRRRARARRAPAGAQARAPRALRGLGSGAALATALAIAFSAGVASRACAGAAITLAKHYPVEGERITLRVLDGDSPVAGARVRVTYRPGSSVETHREVGVTDASGELAWTPEIAGIATVSAEWEGGSAGTQVSVRFAHPPVAGLVIMIGAGLVLVGGSVVRIRRVLLEPSAVDAT